MDSFERRKNLPPIQNLKNEIYNHSILLHPSIVKFVGYSPVNFEHNRYQPVLMMKLIRNGTLKGIIEKLPKKWTNTKKLINIYGIAHAMSYMHHKDILHRDLSITNVLIDKNYYPILSDFGLSIKIDDMAAEEKEVMGTTVYIAPEIWINQKYSKSSDVYAFGFIVYSLITNKIPYSGIKRTIKEACKDNIRPKIPKRVPECYKNLIKRCWNQNPNQRPSFDDIVNELKTNKYFVQGNINKKEFKQYIDFIEDQTKILNNQQQLQ